MQRSAAGSLRLLSCVMGGFLVLMASSKVGWLADAGPLADELWGWRESAPALSGWYLDTVAIPGAALFARLVPLGEFLIGAALLVGFRTRLAAVVALFMVLNFHFAMGLLFQLAYLTNGYGPPVVGSLAALALGPARLPFSVHR